METLRAIVIILVGTHWMSLALAWDESHMDYVISRGVAVDTVQNVVLYSEEQYLHFLIPDLPDLPKISTPKCNVRPLTEACEISLKINDMNQDTLSLLGLINQVLTREGLGDAVVKNVRVPDNLVKPEEKVSDAISEPPPEQTISKVGESWFNILKQRLDMRKLEKTTELDDNERVRRAATLLVATGRALAGISALLGADELFGAFQSLFVNKDKILNIFTTLKAYMPVDRQTFAKIVERISAFEGFTREKFADILHENQDLKNLTTMLDEEIRHHRLSIDVIQEGFGHTQRNIADISTLLFTSVLYLTQFAGFQTCRSRELSLLYTPPHLLRKTLEELEETLPSDVEFAISVENSNLYYTLPMICSCLFDNDGGMIRLTIPLKDRDAVFQLYSVRSLQFAWMEETCYLNLDSAYLVKEMKSGMVYPVTSLDEPACDVENLSRCKIPPSSADDLQTSCTSVILSGGTSSEIKSACEIRCSKHNRPEVSKVRDNVFIATHIRPGTLTISCPNENVTVNEKIEFGAMKIIVSCSCVLRLNNRIVGRSTTKLCNPDEILSISTLIPAHMTTAQDIIHFDSSGGDSIRYRHKEEFFDADFMKSLKTEPGDELVVANFNLVTMSWNVCQAGLLAYAFYRLRVIGIILLELLNNIPRADAQQQYNCKLPQEAYILLIAILVCSILSIIPQFLFIVVKSFRNCFKNTVQLEATKMNIQQQNELDAKMERELEIARQIERHIA